MFLVTFLENPPNVWILKMCFFEVVMVLFDVFFNFFSSPKCVGPSMKRRRKCRKTKDRKHTFFSVFDYFYWKATECMDFKNLCFWRFRDNFRCFSIIFRSPTRGTPLKRNVISKEKHWKNAENIFSVLIPEATPYSYSWNYRF